MWPSAGLDEAMIARIVDHVAHPIFVKDRQFRFVLLNRALSELVGYPRETMLGKTDHDFFAKAEADFFRAKDEELLRTREAVVIEEEPITDAQGRRHWLATTKVPLRDAQGEVTHIVGIIHDITKLKDAEESLRRAREEAEALVRERTRALEAAQAELVRRERLAVLGQLAGGVAHQIRNPLAVMKNVASILRRAADRTHDPDVSRAAGVLDEEVRQANQIVTDLLDYARVRPAAPARISVDALLDQTVASLELPSSVQVERDVPPGAEVWVDAGQVQRALTNLVRNAVEAMPGGGRLTFAAQVGRDDVVISVTDSGIGIAPDVRRRLFEPLVSDKPQGLGLGLTSARALIENQQGTIACTSREGEPTRFEVRLPRGPVPS